MKIIYNNLIPFKGYKATNLFGTLFVRNGSTVDEIDINHEEIHSYQMKDLLWIFFYIWYGIEWIVRLFQYGGDGYNAYRNISFEREAFENENNLSYLKTRKSYNFINYLKNKTHV